MVNAGLAGLYEQTSEHNRRISVSDMLLHGAQSTGLWTTLQILRIGWQQARRLQTLSVCLDFLPLSPIQIQV